MMGDTVLGKDGLEHDADRPSTYGPRALDELLLTQRKGIRPRDPGEDGDERDGYCEHGVPERWTEDRHHEDGEQEGGEGEDQIDDSHEYAVDPLAEVPGDKANGHAEGRGYHNGEKPHLQGDPSTVNEAAQVVTAQGVGTDGVFQGRRTHEGIIVLVQRVGCEQRGKQRGQGEHDDRSRSEDGRAVSDEAREEQSQQAGTTSVGLIEASVEFDCLLLGRGAHSSRIRGSRYPYRMSASRFTEIYKTEVTRTIIWTIA